MTISQAVQLCKGKQGWIVGTAPTLFDLSKLKDTQDPVCMLNGANSLDPLPNGFFFSYHPDDYEEFIRSKTRAAPYVRTSAVFSKWDIEPYIYFHARSTSVSRVPRERCIRQKFLMRGCGTIISAIHFLWLMEVTKINLVGCSGPDSVYNTELGSVHSNPGGSISDIRTQQARVLEQLGIPVCYH